MSGRHQPEHGADSAEGLVGIVEERLAPDKLRIAFESRFDDQWSDWMDAAWWEAVDEVRRLPPTCSACSLPAIREGYCAGHNRLFDYTDAEAAGGIAANE